VTIVSIDFSILYPGVCICRDFKEFKWIAIANTDIRKKDEDRFDWINKNYPNIKILRTTTRRKKDSQYHITERIKLINYLELIDLLIGSIKEEIKDDQELIFCLEGISFGSSGNSLVDISQSTGILKHQIITQLLQNNHDRFFIFSPSELKNAIKCKGNANKHEILEKFKSDPIIEFVKNSDLFKLLHKEDWVIEKNKILSPIIDMTDSYLGIVKIYELSNF
jgi:Holliday junction resolvasome RuvABC endonuclease subunit